MEINDLYTIQHAGMRNIEIYTNRRKAVLYGVLAIFLLGIDIYMLLFRENYLAEGILSFFLFGGVLAYSIYLLNDKRPAITISSSGITYRGLRGRTIFWERIGDIEVVMPGRTRYVRLNLKRAEATINPRKMSYNIGTQATMIDPYELCELLQLIVFVPGGARQETIDAIIDGVDPSVIFNRYSQ